MAIVVRRADVADSERILRFLREWSYHAAVTDNATVLLAVEGPTIAGLLRLEPEYGVMVLRGMRVNAMFQRQGVGTALLHAASAHLQDTICYCIPYPHLTSFYGQIGFEEVDATEAPPHLRVRLAAYRAEGREMIIMRRPGLGGRITTASIPR